MAEESYVHEPADTGSTRASSPDATDPGVRETQVRPPEERTFDWRGWTLVGVIVVAFLVIPSAIVALPYTAGPSLDVFGLTWRDTFLVLPFVPALALGLTAVWATTRP